MLYGSLQPFKQLCSRLWGCKGYFLQELKSREKNQCQATAIQQQGFHLLGEGKELNCPRLKDVRSQQHSPHLGNGLWLSPNTAGSGQTQRWDTNCPALVVLSGRTHWQYPGCQTGRGKPSRIVPRLCNSWVLISQSSTWLVSTWISKIPIRIGWKGGFQGHAFCHYGGKQQDQHASPPHVVPEREYQSILSEVILFLLMALVWKCCGLVLKPSWFGETWAGWFSHGWTFLEWKKNPFLSNSV